MERPLPAPPSPESAAKLALLALRASIDPRIALVPDLVLVAPSSSAITVDAAARALAAMPKPVHCKAKAENGVLTIDCRPLADADDATRHGYHVFQEFIAEHGGYMSHTIERYGRSDEHLVAAFGRGEVLLVPLRAVEDSFRDYVVDHAGVGIGDVANELAEDRSEYQQAKRLGAVAVVKFHSPDADRGKDQIVAFTFPLPAPKTAAERERMVEQLIPVAVGLHDMLRGARRRGELGDELSENERKSYDVQRRHIKVMAEEIERFFAGEAMPPEVSSFLDEYHRRG